jgi:hypothetical protein
MVRNILIAVVLCLASFSAGKFLTDPKVEIKEVEKVVYRESEDIKTDATRIIHKRETIKPDGTRIIETISTTSKSTDKKKVTEETKDILKDIVTETRPDWRANVIYFPKVFKQDQNIILDIQRRIIGEVYAGLSVSTDRTFGVSVGIGF